MPSLELSMIVKNGATTLARCLESVRPVVDEIIVVDTGSTDTTKDIARHFGAQLFDVPWEDDFSKARNAALGYGRCDWVLFLDADEMLDPEGAASLASLLQHPQVSGYDVRIWNYVSTLNTRMLNRPANPNPHRIAPAKTFAGYVEHVNVRLFRRHAEIFFEGRVHEGVADRMKRIGLPVQPASFLIHHLGSAEDGAIERKRKMEYYRELGLRKLRDDPNDVRAHCELGLGELENFHNPRAGLAHFTKAIELKPDSKLLRTYAGICHTRLGSLLEAQTILLDAERLGMPDAVHLEALGDTHYHLNQMREARARYEAALLAGSRSSVVKSKLGVCEVRLGSPAEGLNRIREAIAEEPGFGELYDILAAAALYAGDGTLAAETAERRLEIGQPTAEAFLLAAGLQAQLENWQRVAGIVRAGLERFPKEKRLRAAEDEVNVKLAPKA